MFTPIPCLPQLCFPQTLTTDEAKNSVASVVASLAETENSDDFRSEAAAVSLVI